MVQVRNEDDLARKGQWGKVDRSTYILIVKSVF